MNKHSTSRQHTHRLGLSKGRFGKAVFASVLTSLLVMGTVGCSTTPTVKPTATVMMGGHTGL